MFPFDSGSARALRPMLVALLSLMLTLGALAEPRAEAKDLTVSPATSTLDPEPAEASEPATQVKNSTSDGSERLVVAPETAPDPEPESPETDTTDTEIESTEAEPEKAEAEEAEGEKKKRFIVVSGWSEHLNIPRHETHAFLGGLGYRQELHRGKNYIMAVEALFFSDSSKDLAIASAATWQYRTKIVDVGVSAGLMYHNDFREALGFPVGPVVAPFVQRDIGPAGIRVLYLPRVKKTAEQVILHLLFEI